MLKTNKPTKRKEYVVKYGYVYSDSYGNHYKAGGLVPLSEKEYDLAKHRVKLYINPNQLEIEGLPRERPQPSSRHIINVQPPVTLPNAPKAEPEKEAEATDEDSRKELSAMLGRGSYEIK